GSLAALAGVSTALFVASGIPFLLAIFFSLIIMIVVGFFNAFMVNKIKLEPFIATLVTQSIIRGVAYIICGGIPIAINDPTFLSLGRIRFLNIPLGVWVSIVAIL